MYDAHLDVRPLCRTLSVIIRYDNINMSFCRFFLRLLDNKIHCINACCTFLSVFLIQLIIAKKMYILLKMEYIFRVCYKTFYYIPQIY